MQHRDAVLLNSLRERPKTWKELYSEEPIKYKYSTKTVLKNTLLSLQSEGLVNATESSPPAWYATSAYPQSQSAGASRYPLESFSQFSLGPLMNAISGGNAMPSNQSLAEASAAKLSHKQAGSSAYTQASHAFYPGYGGFVGKDNVNQYAEFVPSIVNTSTPAVPRPKRILVVVDLGNVHDCLEPLERYHSRDFVVQGFAAKDFNGYGINPAGKAPVVQSKSGMKGENDVAILWWTCSYLLDASRQGDPIRVILATKGRTLLSMKKYVEEAIPGSTFESVTDWQQLQQIL